MTGRIYYQIETAADLYGPSVYALLPLFRDFQRAADPTSANFIPLTAARLTSESSGLAERHKIFVIGILPPPIEVTGRYLDRGTNLGGQAAADAAGAVGSTTPPEEPTKYGSNPADCTAAVGAAEIRPLGSTTEAQSLEFLAAPGDYVDGKLNPFTEAYLTGVGGGTNCCNTVMGIWRKCGIQDPRLERSKTSYKYDSKGRMMSDTASDSSGIGACGWYVIAKQNGAWDPGTNGATFPSVGDAVLGRRLKDKTDWDSAPDESQQHAITILSVNGRSTTSAEGGHFRALGSDGKTRTGPVQGVYDNIQYEWQFRKGHWYYRDKYAIRLVLGWARVAELPAGNSTVQPDTNTGNWAEDGSDPAKDAASQTETEAGKDPRQEAAGDKYQAEQKRMIDATREALDRLKNTPPLKLLVNPTSFKVGSEKIISEGNRSRSQVIVEHWGEQQDKIEGSGKLAGFYSIDYAGLSGGPGLTRTARQYSASYQNFLSLFQIYKSNGGLWLQDFFDVRLDPGAKNLSCLGSVYIYYDNILYIGSFDTLTLSESDTAPYTLEYSFTFSARAAFLLDRELENPQQDYGMAGLFPQPLPTSSGATTTEAPVYVDPAVAELAALSQSNLEEDAAFARDEAAADAAANAAKANLDATFESPTSGGNNAITPGKGSKSKSVGR